jgi:predicted metal-dependent peptidase
LSELQLSNKFKRASIQSLFGKELTDGKTVSSNVLLRRCLMQNTFSNSNNELAALLSRHDIPVKLEELPSGKLMATRTYADGSVVILINPNHSNRLSNRRLSDSLLHEVIHALTVSAITNPKTKEDREFAKRNRQMF